MKYINNKSDSEIFQRIKKVAEHGIFDGKEQDNPYLLNCRWFIEKYGCSVIFTKDEGMHSCGWCKNPDYEKKFIQQILHQRIGTHFQLIRKYLKNSCK